MGIQHHKICNALHANVLRKYHADGDCLVLNEFGLQHGAVRADVAVINGKLQGFEIKSDNDTLDRLPFQVESYNSVFDRNTLVVSEKHLDAALPFVQDWWGVLVSRITKEGKVIFKTKRHSKRNPLMDRYAICQLLWKDEVEQIIRNTGETGSILKMNRAYMYDYLAKEFSMRELRKIVCSTLKSRQHWRGLTPLS